MTKTATSDCQKSQLDKFKEAARELECDDDERRFKVRLKRIAKQKPPDEGEDA